MTCTLSRFTVYLIFLLSFFVSSELSESSLQRSNCTNWSSRLPVLLPSTNKQQYQQQDQQNEQHTIESNGEQLGTDNFNQIKRVTRRDIIKQEDGFVEGPRFVSLPTTLSKQIDFYNTTGLTLTCKAEGLPRPSIKWIKGNPSLGSVSQISSSSSSSSSLSSSLSGPSSPASLSNPIEVDSVKGLRIVRPDGSLILQPFRSDQFRQDIHITSYRCIAYNKVGSIVSPEIHIRAVMKQDYSIQSSDEFVLMGNAGLLPCSIPAIVKDFVKVIHWQRSDGLIITTNSLPSESIHLLDDGSLLFEKVTSEDSRWKYRCTVRDLITGEQVNSLTWSKLILTDSSMKSAPRLIGSLKDLWIQMGTNIRLGCVSQANPAPSYYWLKEDSVSTKNTVNHSLLKHSSIQSNGPMLFLRSIQLHDSGTYTCLVNNSLGQDRLRFKLNVLEPLSVSMRPSKLYRRKEGELAGIDCLVKTARDHHVGLYTFEWLKDSRPIVFGSRIKLISWNKLRIVSLVREDRGMYQCFVRTDGPVKNIASASLHLHIEEEAPRLISNFKSQLLEEGYSLSLKCSAIGSPLPQIRWNLYHKTIDGQSHRGRYRIGDYVDTNSHIVSFLNVSSVTREEGGLYTCEAFNDVGRTRYSAPISILGPPIVHTMENVTILSSGRVSIECPFSGHPISQIIWKKNGQSLPISRRISSHSNGTLSLVDVHMDDEGWYRCEVTNGQDTAQGSLYVHILEKPVINPFMFGSDLTEGMRATVVCSILSGDPPLTFSWYKEGIQATQIHDDIEISSFTDSDSSFRIKSVKRSHSGNYTCVVSSSNISANYTAEMIVKASPRWIIKPDESYSLLRGKNVVIDCQTDGYPQPTHQWKKVKTSKLFEQNRELIGIVSGPHIQVLENGSISIVDIAKDDEGIYICESSNNVGPPLAATTRLTVHQPVRFGKNFEILEANRGDSVGLSCYASGDHPISLSWVRDRETLLPFHENGRNYRIEEEQTDYGLKSKLIIGSVDVTDSAFFTCQGTNAYGLDEKNIQLVVRGPPEPPSNLKLGEVKSRAVSLGWSAPVNGNSPLLGYIVEYTTSNDSWSNSLETASVDPKDLSSLITGLTPETIYRFRVIAQNALGQSLPSQEIIIRTEEEAPSEPPINVRVEALSSQSLKVNWANIAKTKRIDGYHIGYRQVHGFNSMRETFNFKTLSLNESMKESDSLHYYLKDLKRNTKYGIIIRAYNRKGPGVASEEIFSQTLEFDPPGEVQAQVISVTHRSLTIEVDGQPQENPINGYIVNYKSNTEDWEEVKILGSRKNFVIENLRCGTKYSISVTPYNKAGPSPESKMFHASTSGNVPSPGSLESLLTVNSSCALIDLSAWSENGCPILSFVVQYKQHFQTDWIMFSNNIMPSQGKLFIPDLIPSTWYDLLMIANSEPGTTEAQYLFATLTPTGGTIPPISSNTYSNWELSLGDPVVLAPILCAFIVFIVIFITIAILMSTKQHQRTDSSQETYSTNERQKMESLSMASFGLPTESSVESKKIYETVQRKSAYGSYYTSPYAANRLNFCEQDVPLSQQHQLHRHSRVEHESHYDDLLSRNFRSNSPS